MERYEHWFTCLDLTSMDDVLVGYSKFLTTEFKPKKITFIHVVKSTDVAEEMIELFPEIESQHDFEKVIREKINEAIDAHFKDSPIETELLIRTGRPTDEIISAMNQINPDLTIMGKKAGYSGKGVIPRRIMKYVPTSILFVPETSRYQLNNILVPVDFSEQSALSIKAALELSGDKSGSVTAQHVYNYPARFFPYLPENDDEKKMNDYLNKKRDDFISKHDIPDNVKFVFSLNIDGPKMEQIYDQVVHDQADMIVAATKAGKGMASMLREDFTDKLAYFRFGVPLLLIKDKEKHSKFLSTIFKKS
ncbi:MAG: universal stress protein [Balneolaceae bacterium]|nr:universal stress protein [Balneolaceae bacterium]